MSLPPSTAVAADVNDVDQLRASLLSVERHTLPTLSPDGRSVSYVQTDENGPEVWWRRPDGGRRRLAQHHGELVHDLRWTVDGRWVLYRHTTRGRESRALSAVRVADGERRQIGPPGPAIEYWLSASDPTAVVVSRRPGSTGPDLFRCDLAHPEREPVRIARNNGFHRWLVDPDLRPRGGVRLQPDGSFAVVIGANLESARVVMTIDVDAGADLAVPGFSRDGRYLYVLSSSGAATRRLLGIDSTTGSIKTLFQHSRLDLESYPIAGEGVWFDPVTGRPDLCSVMDQRIEHHVLADQRRDAVARMLALSPEATVIVDRNADDSVWLIVHVHVDGPISYRLFRPHTGETESLFANRPDLVGRRLPRLEDVRFAARDGCEITGYAMRPLDRTTPLPTAVLVHGGPAGRDRWRFHADAHYLCSLGVQSLHINYRGSRGFGTTFRQAGDGEWGGRMQTDLYDAIDHGVSTGSVDPRKVFIFGSSYGGYAALLAACTRPDLVRCAIAVSPPCDLVAFAGSPPPFWQPLAVMLRRQVLGHGPAGPLDEQILRDRSPQHVLTSSCAPLLVAHGVRDPRVPVADVDRFVTQARELAVPVRYLRFDDEGHQVNANANRRTLFAEIENFLEVHLDEH